MEDEIILTKNDLKNRLESAKAEGRKEREKEIIQIINSLYDKRKANEGLICMRNSLLDRLLTQIKLNINLKTQNPQIKRRKDKPIHI